MIQIATVYALTVLITLNTFWWQLVSHPVAQMINMLQNDSVFHKRVIKMCTFQSIIAISFWATCWFPEVKPLLFFLFQIKKCFILHYFLTYPQCLLTHYIFIYLFIYMATKCRKKHPSVTAYRASYCTLQRIILLVPVNYQVAKNKKE